MTRQYPGISAGLHRTAIPHDFIFLSREAYFAADDQSHVRRFRPDQLSAVLDRVTSPLVTVAAPWDLLTVNLSRTVASWAMRDETRGFSLLPIFPSDALAPPDYFPVSVRRNAWPPAYVHEVDVWQSEQGITHSVGHQDVVNFETILQRQAAASYPIGFAITDHGGEHCIKFGEKWLCTHPQFAPEQNSVLPKRIRSPVVLLNSCGSLRLGDSIVPPEFSLATRLFAGSAQVIGPFRLLTPQPEAQGIFVQSLLDGVPLGRIVNRLNRNHSAVEAGGPAYAMLGDASLTATAPADQCARVSGESRRERAALVTASQDRSPARSIELGKLVWWDRLTSAFERCAGLSPATLKIRAEFLQVFQIAKQYERVQHIVGLVAEEFVHLETMIASAFDELRASTLADIAGRISAGRWLTSIYGPFSAAPAISTYTCPDCHSTGLRMRYNILDADSMFATRDECDRCGTQHDSIGRRPARKGFRVSMSKDGLSVTVPALKPDEVGRVMLHRMAHPPQDWPAEGGTCQFPPDALAMCGRRVAVALKAGPYGLQARYGFFFLPPGGGERS